MADSPIVVVRFSSLGDVVLTSAVFENIKLNRPGSFIYFLTKKEYSEIFREDPYIDRIIPLEDFSLMGLLKFIRKIKPCYVFDLHNSLRSNIIDFFSRGKVLRVKKYRKERKKMLKGKFSEIPTVVERYLNVLRNAGFKIHINRPRLYLSFSETEGGKEILKNLGIPLSEEIITLAPFSKWKNKEWPHFKRFIEIASKPGRYFLILGEDFSRGQTLIPEGYKGNFVKNLSGLLTLRDVMAVLKHSSLVISVDSALAHIADALGKPLIVLFGPTHPAFGFAPQNAKILQVDIPCRPCHLHGGNVCKRGDNACLASITPEEVLAAL